MTTVTQADLARHLGTSRSYITALKAADRLVLADDGKGIDLEASLARIEATRDPQRADVSERHANARAGTLLAASQAKEEASTPPPAHPEPEDANSYQAARALKEKYAAKTARMEYERAIGKLIERQAVEDAIEDVMTIVRQQLEQMPNRVSPQLIDQPLDTVRATLKREVHDILTEMVREFHVRLKEMQQ
jgi:hypothetical protein